MPSNEWDNEWTEETASEKTRRKAKENPLVPVGVLCALGACGYAAYNFKSRNKDIPGERDCVSELQLRGFVIWVLYVLRSVHIGPESVNIRT